ncbi:MAG TPA: ATP-dependent DNA helicase PcrA, partial [Candidatus Latescibacteria bacterium]|nr:ATP-dependent DNA helicase PcrA [Candidatus Latescibacterota bacterium]
AGAGSGKTRVLTYKIAYLTSVLGVNPRKILAVTFTNKAAEEMRRRVERLIGLASLDMWIGTFHSICARILRRESDAAGLSPDFVIYDPEDQLTIIKEVMQGLGISQEQFPPKMVRAKISRAKNQLIGPEQFTKSAQHRFEETTAKIYKEYQKKLKINNALDFDDLLMKPVEMFKSNPYVLEKYQDRFEFILVDEYQDTNHAQYVLVKQLASKNRNLCVVGDDDQSIYGWRGADIRNILEFERDYPEAKVVRLERNYRSTKCILEAASAVVRNNKGRKGKELWTSRGRGSKLVLFECVDEIDEAQRVVETIIRERVQHRRRLNDFVILYRINAQSRALEDGLRRRGIPYVIVGGLRFYERKEIKDILAYLKLICNPRDSVSLKRIINIPRRGIGGITVAKLEEFATRKRLGLFQALEEIEEIDRLSERVRAALRDFRDLILSFIKAKEDTPADRLIAALVDGIGYLEVLGEESTLEARARIANVKELLAAAGEFVERSDDPSLDAFLTEVSLITDVDRWDQTRDAVTLMTLHCAKGLEFPVVFITGLEDGRFPLSRPLEGNEELEEERRLFYVGMTRAKEKLFLSLALNRRGYSSTMSLTPESRFVRELPEHLLIRERLADRFAQELDLPVFNVGNWVIHPSFGRGRIVAKSGFGEKTKLVVRFEGVGEKRLLLKYAQLEAG